MDDKFKKAVEDLAFEGFIKEKKIPEKTDKIIREITPESQGDLLLSQTYLEVNEREKDFSLITSEFGMNLSENKNLPKANYYSISRWGKWRGISEQFFYPITNELIQRPRNPHKGWFTSLQKGITYYLKGAEK